MLGCDSETMGVQSEHKDARPAVTPGPLRNGIK